MISSEEKRNCNGYIIKLYKRVANIPGQEIINKSMFMTWMNFDCMDILGIDEFPMYNSTINIKELEDKQKYATRQKFFIYSLDLKNELNGNDANNNDLLSTNGELDNFPLITLTMFDIQHNSQDSEDKCKLKLLNYLDDIKKDTSIKGQVYGCLSLYDYVLVLRGNNYEEMNNILNSFREKLNSDSKITFKRMYTIPGIDLTNVEFWHFTNLKASIRISCTSDITASWLHNNIRLNTALKIQEIYSILGKYDFDIIGEIKSSKDFVDIFLSDGPLSAKGSHIHKTNTRFLKGTPKSINNGPEDVNNTLFVDVDEKRPYNDIDSQTFQKSDEFDKMLEKFQISSFEIQGLSLSIQENLSRLILRTFQVIVSINNRKIAEDLTNKLYNFWDFINTNQQEAQKLSVKFDMVNMEDVYSQIIDIFNLFLDNRVSAGISDFETPQNVLRYSGSSMKVILAYSGFVDYLMKILSFNKQRENRLFDKKQIVKYLSFVTADPVAKVTATRFLRHCEKYRLFNIKIPVDMIFEVEKVLPLITHEAGHFICAGWIRKDRNAAYYKSVSRAIVRRLMPFENSRFNKDPDITSDTSRNDKKAFLNVKADDKNFDNYCYILQNYFKKVIYTYTIQYNEMFYIPYNESPKLCNDVEVIAEGLQRIYEESIADMFMLGVLGIKELDDYLKIHKEYFKRLNIDIKDIPQENVSRIMAVSVVLADIDYSNYEEVKKHFQDEYVNCSNDQITPIMEKLKNYRTYYLLEPLVEFLELHVKKGLKELLEQKEIEKIQDRIEQSYLKLKNGRFEDYLDFVLNFK